MNLLILSLLSWRNMKKAIRLPRCWTDCKERSSWQKSNWSGTLRKATGPHSHWTGADSSRERRSLDRVVKRWVNQSAKHLLACMTKEMVTALKQVHGGKCSIKDYGLVSLRSVFNALCRVRQGQVQSWVGYFLNNNNPLGYPLVTSCLSNIFISKIIFGLPQTQ